MKARIDENCTGCGLCPEICPEVFEMGDDGLAHVKAETVPEGEQAAAQEACDSCPVSAIHLET
jgi:ferredoxin